MPLFRRFGVRTSREIERERYALKALRGDFAAIAGHDAPGAALSGERSAAMLRGDPAAVAARP
jgi:hypothetical protein